MNRSQLPFVGVEGRPLSEENRALLIEAIVDDHAILPDSFTLRFGFESVDMWERLGIKIGDAIEIKSGVLGESPTSTLLHAEVTSIEAVMSYGSRYLVVRGYDASHRLHSGRRTRSFNNVTDSDLAQRIASDAGLDVGTIEPTSAVHEHISQINVTDMEFLRRRAREIGYVVAVRDGRFSFQAIGGASDPRPPVELTVGDQLTVFRPRVTAAQQVPSVTARGWDMTSKEAVVHDAPAATASVALAERGWDPVALAEVFSSAEFLTCDQPIASSAEAEALAVATAEEIASSFAEADARCTGDPRLVCGAAVDVRGAGPFDGEWIISHSRHRFDEDGYHTEFEVSGRQERSLLGLTSLGSSSDGAPPIYGSVIAVVTNVVDPQNLGRVKLTFPWLSDDYESDFARVCYPGAGADRGLFVPPEVDDEVLVVFERGDVRRPFVVGNLFNGVDAPPSNDYVDSSDGAIVARQWTSRTGHTIAISDKDDEHSIELSTDDGKYVISISRGGEEISITSDAAISITAKSELTLSAQDVTIEASKNLTMNGQTTKIDGASQTEITGALVKIN